MTDKTEGQPPPRKAAKLNPTLTPGSKSQICYPYLRNVVCRYGDECFRVHIPTLDARSDVRPNVKTAITDEMRTRAREDMTSSHSRHDTPAPTGAASNTLILIYPRIRLNSILKRET